MISPASRPRFALGSSMLGATLLLAAGCGGSSPAATSGSAGHGGTSGGAGTIGTSGTAGTIGTTGAAGATGGTSATGVAGAVGTAGTVGSSGSGGVNTTGAGGLGWGGAGGASGAGAQTASGCDPNGPQCNNCKDDDGDGLVDYLDPECVGALDNDESSFATGISGDNVDACKQDCFFDGNSGMGDDHCLWQLKCDPLNTAGSCAYDPTYASSHQTECSVSASQSQQCIDFCKRLVPNGCDCFGCCAIPGGPTIRLAATCTADKFNDPVACPPCTQVTQCSNPCGHCEICIGKPTLPADCFTTPDGGTGTDGGGPDGSNEPPGTQCDGENPIPCGPGTSTPADGCPVGQGCLTGCCFPLPP